MDSGESCQPLRPTEAIGCRIAAWATRTGLIHLNGTLDLREMIYGEPDQQR